MGFILLLLGLGVPKGSSASASEKSLEAIMKEVVHQVRSNLPEGWGLDLSNVRLSIKPQSALNKHAMAQYDETTGELWVSAKTARVSTKKQLRGIIAHELTHVAQHQNVSFGWQKATWDRTQAREGQPRTRRFKRGRPRRLRAYSRSAWRVEVLKEGQAEAVRSAVLESSPLDQALSQQIDQMLREPGARRRAFIRARAYVAPVNGVHDAGEILILRLAKDLGVRPPERLRVRGLHRIDWKVQSAVRARLFRAQDRARVIRRGLGRRAARPRLR